MINGGLRLPFAWYDDISKQAARKKSCKGDCCYKLITPNDRLLPFQFRSASFGKNDTVTLWHIYKQDGTMFADLTSQVSFVELYSTTSGMGYCQYKGNAAFTGVAANMDCGFYYSKIVINGNDFYSENFFVPFTFSEDDYMAIELWDSCDVGNVLFQKGWHGKFYIGAEIEKSTHEVFEEGIEDGLKDFYPTFQKYMLNLRFDEFCPEFMVAALVALQMYREVKITTKLGFAETKAFNIKTAVTWEENGCNAIVEVKFQQEDDFLRTGCCGNMKLEI